MTSLARVRPDGLPRPLTGVAVADEGPKEYVYCLCKADDLEVKEECVCTRCGVVQHTKRDHVAVEKDVAEEDDPIEDSDEDPIEDSDEEEDDEDEEHQVEQFVQTEFPKKRLQEMADCDGSWPGQICKLSDVGTKRAKWHYRRQQKAKVIE